MLCIPITPSPCEKSGKPRSRTPSRAIQELLNTIRARLIEEQNFFVGRVRQFQYTNIRKPRGLARCGSLKAPVELSPGF